VTRRRIVVLGMISRHPVPGMVWLTLQYLLGFTLLGFETYYVEAHAGTPKMFMDADDDGSVRAAGFIADIMARFDMHGRWAFHALHADGRCYGLDLHRLNAIYESAALIVNLHGGTTPLPEHAAGGRLVYVGTDPVDREVALQHNDADTIALLEPHAAFFTWAANYGQPDCGLPVTDRFTFHATRQPIVCELWADTPPCGGTTFTTVAGWRQLWREVQLNGELYHWSKHFEFLKFVDLPKRCDQPFELALSGFETADRELLETNGWSVRAASELDTLDAYRGYLQQSRGEFTVAKDQNVRLRTGWFSDRSAAYLAAGRPVICQDTAFDRIIPAGRGLFAFSTIDDILDAVDRVNADYPAHCKAASELAREYFDHGTVLSAMLEHLDV
jgi:hypothetical protein